MSSGDCRDPGGDSMRMCRPCSAALESTRTALGEITGRLREDEYDVHSFPQILG